MKNPFLSFWLSNANAWSGAMRGLWSAELQRQQTHMMTQMTQQMLRFWTGAWMTPPTAAALTRDRQRPSGRS